MEVVSISEFSKKRWPFQEQQQAWIPVCNCLLTRNVLKQRNVCHWGFEGMEFMSDPIWLPQQPT